MEQYQLVAESVTGTKATEIELSVLKGITRYSVSNNGIAIADLHPRFVALTDMYGISYESIEKGAGIKDVVLRIVSRTKENIEIRKKDQSGKRIKSLLKKLPRFATNSRNSINIRPRLNGNGLSLT